MGYLGSVMLHRYQRGALLYCRMILDLEYPGIWWNLGSGILGGGGEGKIGRDTFWGKKDDDGLINFIMPMKDLLFIE